MAALGPRAPRRAQALISSRATSPSARINSPMQCMMKEICAQCLQPQARPLHGQDELCVLLLQPGPGTRPRRFRRRCQERLRQNSLQEKLTRPVDRSLPEETPRRYDLRRPSGLRSAVPCSSASSPVSSSSDAGDADFGLGLLQALARLVVRVRAVLHVFGRLEQRRERAGLLAAVPGLPIKAIRALDDPRSVVFGRRFRYHFFHGSRQQLHPRLRKA